MNWINLLLGTKGRINRKTFIIGLVPILLLFALVYVYLKFLTGLLPRWADIALPTLIALEALYFTANLATKRMHDYGRSAHYLWLLFAPLILTVGFLFQQKFIALKTYEGAVVIYTILASLALLTFFWMLIEMLFLRSHEQKNRFGTPPDSKTDGSAEPDGLSPSTEK